MSIEDEHVKKVYNEISSEFDDTRYRPWSCVEKFLDNVPEGSIIGDIGCGNGKNMLYRNDCDNYGCDFSEKLVEICKNKNLNVIEGDILDIPFEDNSFDYTICIAVIHHLSTVEKRRKAITELQRVTKNNGKILILVWAFEQESDSRRKFTEQDNMVDWKDKKGNLLGKRYYYVFKENELESLVDNKNLIIKNFYEKSNWGLILKNINNINIVNADSLEYLKTLDDNSIDCIITDPPYFIDKLDNNWSSKKVNNDKKNSHIKHLPKGMKFDKKQVKNLYDFYLELSKILFDKLKPGGYFLSFSSPRLYHSIAMACDIAGFEIRDMINWVYTQSMPKGMSIEHIIKKRKDLSDEEKSKLIEEYKNFKTPQIKSCFEPICVAFKPIKKTFLQNELDFKTGLLDFSNKVGIDNDKVISNVITTEEFNELYDKNFLISKPNKEEKGEFNNHITVKPVKLIEHLIKIFSKENSLVVDPFLGSGTTAVACKNLNRKCIGIELNKEYYDICLQRLNI
jgi:site-specific DNA-methyltransferase (adenine-specific)